MWHVQKDVVFEVTKDFSQLLTRVADDITRCAKPFARSKDQRREAAMVSVRINTVKIWRETSRDFTYTIRCCTVADVNNILKSRVREIRTYGSERASGG